MNGKNDLVNIGFVARVLGVSTETIRTSSHRYGLTPYLTPGGHRRFLMCEVQAAADKLKNKRLKELEILERERAEEMERVKNWRIM